MKTVYDFTVTQANGQSLPLSNYMNRPMIIVNTASKCGFTPQFEELQDLYNDYEQYGLEILGFPCAQFKNQEFENIEETTEFCKVNYGVTFPVLSKIDVNGEHADPLFAFLKKKKGGIISNEIKWNFTKFLVDRNGQVIKRYSPTTSPHKMRQDVLNVLEKKD